MNKDTTFRLLVLVCVALLAYIVYTNTRELVELELEVDRLRGGLAPATGVPPVPAADVDGFGASKISQATTFEETMRGD